MAAAVLNSCPNAPFGRSFLFRFGGMVGVKLVEEFLANKFTTNTPPAQVAGNGLVLREGPDRPNRR